MNDLRYRHIFLDNWPRTQGYTSRGGGGAARKTPPRDRSVHAALLQQRLEGAWREAEERRAVALAERHGMYLEFDGEPGYDLAFGSLELRRSGIRLLNVQSTGAHKGSPVRATVYVPNEKRRQFLKKITRYAQEDTPTGKPKNRPLIESISDIRLAVLESFWLDNPDNLPGDAPAWVEVWLRTQDGDAEQTLNRLAAVVRECGIERGDGELHFPERLVVMILADRNQLQSLIESSDDIAEMRGAKELATYYVEMENVEQLEAAKALLKRTTVEEDTSIAVCILDHGVNRGHLLLRPVLATEDCHAVDPAWGPNDDDQFGHGTAMAGICAFGDILEALQSNGRILIRHRLESAKILPPPPDQNDPKLYGFITGQGVYRAEIQAPDRQRIICLAVTCEETQKRGRPSSWSAALDNLASGAEDGRKRLIVVSGGNVADNGDWLRYPESNLTKAIHDPGQAWNVLTVGAYTEKVRITDPTMRTWSPIAPAGGLSPYSTTSLEWETKWPIKPEVLFEGGNIAKAPVDQLLDHEDLKLLSTSHQPLQDQFVPFSATSAAAAQAARMAAIIQSQYPMAWPETVRALIVHSANWTEEMKRQFLKGKGKGEYASLLRICGYGVPDLDEALSCAENSLTLISQAKLQPFDKRDGRPVTRDMHLYDLPWPIEELQRLQETKVKMRVTLSYFSEPGPGEVGRKDRYRYPSFGLRFAVKSPEEDTQQFVKRVNAAALENKEKPETKGPTSKWMIGEQARNKGSIHSDIWSGTAQDLAESGKIIVYPTIGWWRERSYLGKWNKSCRYSLVVSIHTPPETVDIYTPVAVQVKTKIPIEIPTR